ncbi:MAG: hypothetical protein ACYDBQ_01430 [Thermoplasmatota archaeon]
MIQNKPGFVLWTLVLAAGIVFFLVSVSGLLWPASPWNDVGVLSVTLVTVPLGAAGMLASRYPNPDAQA